MAQSLWSRPGAAWRIARSPAPTLRSSKAPGHDRRAVLMAVTLRTFADGDLDALFTWESDPRAVRMAAFTRANPSDRSAFDAHYERVRSDPSNRLLAIDDGGEFVGDGRELHDGGRTGGHLLDRAGAMGSRARVAGLRAFLAIE